MSDSSGDEDLTKFKEAIDTSFIRLIDESKGISKVGKKPLHSERYLEIASHYNDVKVPVELQKQIGARVSEIIKKNIEFVDVSINHKKRKIKGGVKLFTTSDGFLSCEELKDEHTKNHNKMSKKLKKIAKKKSVEDNENGITENDKIQAAVVSGEYVLSKEETKCWKSRRKEKLFKYKCNGKSKFLTAL